MDESEFIDFKYLCKARGDFIERNPLLTTMIQIVFTIHQKYQEGEYKDPKEKKEVKKKLAEVKCQVEKILKS